jgi:hypothetical protein
MKYSKFSTIKLGIQTGFRDCLSNLNTLIVKEGCLEGMPLFDNSDVVLDMDCVESKIAKSEGRTNKKSMDSLLVVNDSSGYSQIVFVEFRFNYKSMKNLKAKDLRGKKKYSKKNMNDLGFHNINNNYYYVFDPDLKAQARRYFRSLYPSMPSNFKPISISELKDIFF